MGEKPTIKEIAKLANVSVGTVDRVLHNRGDVSKKTTQLIKEIMENLDYVPNTFARNLALNKSFKIAVLLPEHQKGEYWSDPIRGAKKAMKDFKALGVIVKIYLYDQKEKESFSKVGEQIIKDQNEAVLLAQVLFDETNLFIRKCKANKIPFVLIGSSHNDSGAISYIGQNSHQGGRLAGELISFGHKAASNYLVFNVTKAENPNFNVKERIEGFQEYFENNGVKKASIEIFSIPQEDHKLVEKAKTKLNSIPDLKGIFVPNSKSYILSKALPKDSNIRIVGYDLLEKNKSLLQDGTVHFLINQKPYEQAYHGIEYLYKYLGMNQQPPEIVSLPLDIVTREKLMYY